MKYPKELVEEVRKRSEGMKLEGINSGSGPKHPLLMLVGEAPGRNEIVNNIPFSGDAGLDYEIDYAQPKLIVALGSTGLERLLGSGHKISEEHGTVIENTPILKLNSAKDGYIWSKERYTIFPEYHPAAIFYNRKLTDIIVKDWEVIKPYLAKERETNE